MAKMKRLLGRCAWCWHRGETECVVGRRSGASETTWLCVRHFAWLADLMLSLKGEPDFSGSDGDDVHIGWEA